MIITVEISQQELDELELRQEDIADSVWNMLSHEVDPQEVVYTEVTLKVYN